MDFRYGVPWGLVSKSVTTSTPMGATMSLHNTAQHTEHTCCEPFERYQQNIEGSSLNTHTHTHMTHIHT